MWQVDFGRRLFVETEILDVTDDADDLPARVRLLVPVPSEHDALADRILVREETPGRRLAEHGHLRRFSGVGVGEHPAALQRDAKRREVVRRRHSHLHRRLAARLRRRAPLDIEGQVDFPAGEREANHGARRTDARQRAQSIEEPREELRATRLVGVRRFGQREPERQGLARTESRIDVLEADEAVDEQPGADEEGNGERHLGDDERTAYTGSVTPGERPAAAVLERRHQRGLRCLHGGYAAEEQSRQERCDARERQDGAVDPHLVESRDAVRPQPDQQVAAP